MIDLNRRGFVRRLGQAAGAGALLSVFPERLSGTRGGRSPDLHPSPPAPRPAGHAAGGPLIVSAAAARPVAISSRNGLRATERALEIMADGSDALEAVVSGVNLVEEDPDDRTVGYGGLPNASGVVQLDSQVYHGPTRGVGAVAALEGYMYPSRVAVAVMRYTDHILLVGEGAARFAAEMGFRRTDLLTSESRMEWLCWRARLSEDDDYIWPDEAGKPAEQMGASAGAGSLGECDEMGMLDSTDGVRPMGTIHCAAVDSNGDLAAVTTTSGLSFKVPGRVGDSPLPGCGCYCDNDVGAAGATGRGEAVIKTVGSHLVVEEMRRGAHPTDACLTAVRRIVEWTVERRLLRDDGRPTFNVNYYAVNRIGETGGAAIWAGNGHAVGDGRENRLVDSAYLFEGKEEPL